MYSLVINEMLRSKKFLLLGLISIVTSVLSVGLPAINSKFIDSLVERPDYSIIYGLAIAVALLGFFSACMLYVKNVLTACANAEIEYRILRRYILRIEETGLWIVERMSSGHCAQRVWTDVSTITSYVISNVFSSVSNLLVIVGVFLALALKDRGIFFLTLLLCACYLVACGLLKGPLKNAQRKKKEEASRYFGITVEEVGNVAHIQMNSTYQCSMLRFESGYNGYRPMVAKTARLNSLFTSADALISAVFQAILFIYAGLQIVNGSMTIGDLTLISSYFSILLGCFKYYVSLFQYHVEARASYERLLEIDRHPRSPCGVSQLESLSSIQLGNFQNAGAMRLKTCMALDNLHLHFVSGKSYAIYGQNGVGKSTLIKYLTGVYLSREGTILYNGLPLESIDLTDCRRKCLAIVPQEFTSVDEQVGRYLCDTFGLSADEVECELHKSKYKALSETVRKCFEKSYRELSGGERRRVNLWGALSKKQASLVVLDEPTSELDAGSRCEVIEALRQLKHDKIVVVVTHDENLLEVCDEIICLSESSSDYG